MPADDPAFDGNVPQTCWSDCISLMAMLQPYPKRKPCCPPQIQNADAGRMWIFLHSRDHYRGPRHTHHRWCHRWTCPFEKNFSTGNCYSYPYLTHQPRNHCYHCCSEFFLENSSTQQEAQSLQANNKLVRKCFRRRRTKRHSDPSVIRAGRCPIHGDPSKVVFHQRHAHHEMHGVVGRHC